MELTAMQVLEALADPASPYRAEVERRLVEANLSYLDMAPLQRERYLGEMQIVQQRFLEKWKAER